MFKHKELVTVRLEENNKAANTYMVLGHIVGIDEESGEDFVSDAVAIYHPLQPEIILIRQVDQLNKVQAALKDSTERSLEFSSKFQEHLDFNTKAELESLRMYFVVHRNLSNRQKNQLSSICGTIAAIHFHNDISLAMRYIVENNAVLDDYNRMWYTNFRDLFTGRKQITSPKQRGAIFNIAGFVLAELESQKTKK